MQNQHIHMLSLPRKEMVGSRAAKAVNTSDGKSSRNAIMKFPAHVADCSAQQQKEHSDTQLLQAQSLRAVG